MRKLNLSLNLSVLTLFLGFGILNLESQVRQPVQVNSGAGSLEMLVTGSGKPAVVFESGFDDTLEDWAGVTALLSTRTTTVAYSRAGIGGSPMNGEPRTARQIAVELHTALMNAKIAPPYLLVGHSAGGMYVRLFAYLYPADVAGIVLVDPAPEEFYDLVAREYPDLWKALQQQNQGGSPGVLGQMAANATTVKQVAAAWPLPSVPVTLLSATNIEPPVFTPQRREEFSSLQRAMVQKIPGALMKEATGCGHNIPVECPTVISGAVLTMLDKISSLKSAQSASSLPEAPTAQAPSIEGADPISPLNASSITGEVTDESGEAISNASITLSDEESNKRMTIQPGPDGEFTLTGLSSGIYHLTVAAKDFEVFRTAPLIVAQGQSYHLNQIQLKIQAVNTNVTVRPVDVVAAQEIRDEEKQRVFGVIPNFYVSYVFNAAPLTAKQKFTLSLHNTLDPTSFVFAAAAAAIDQGNKTFPGYGLGAKGYGKRVAARYGDSLTDDLLSNALFPALLHQDPRYFYLGTGSFKSRFIHAVSFSVIARSDTGRAMPAYSSFLGDLGSGALSNLYYPHADRGAGLVFSNAGFSIAGRALGGLVREFLLTRVTSNVPSKN